MDSRYNTVQTLSGLGCLRQHGVVWLTCRALLSMLYRMASSLVNLDVSNNLFVSALNRVVCDRARQVFNGSES